MYYVYTSIQPLKQVYIVLGAGERWLFLLCFRRLGGTGNGNYTRGLEAVKREKFANKGTLTLSCHYYSFIFTYQQQYAVILY